jgi:hypothetical protein
MNVSVLTNLFWIPLQSLSTQNDINPISVDLIRSEFSANSNNQVSALLTTVLKIFKILFFSQTGQCNN